MKILKCCGWLLLLVLQGHLNKCIAQISYGGKPYLLEHTTNARGIEYSPSVAQFDKFDNAVLNQKYIDRPEVEGDLFEVNVDFMASANTYDLDDGQRLHLMKVKSEGAISIDILCDYFELSPSAKLFVYSADMTQILGSFDARNNREHKKFLLGPITGHDEVIIELVEKKTDKSKIHFFRIAHGFKLGQMNDISSCTDDISCSAGNNYQLDKRGVCRIRKFNSQLSSGTGFLINSTSQKPYLMSALHVFGCDGPSPSWSPFLQFDFSHETSECNNANTESTSKSTYVGAMMRSKGQRSDYVLLELETSPPASEGLTYLGWNRTDQTITSFAGIHHPGTQGTKKISTGVIDPSKVFARFSPECSNGVQLDIIESSGSSTDWKVTWNNGVTAGGSSGSPLLDQNNRIRGQLRGGSSSCGGPSGPDYYGMLNVSWDNPDPDFPSLASLLDPSGSGISVYNARSTLNGGFISDFDFDINSGFNVKFYDKSVPGNRITQRRWDFGDGSIDLSSINPSHTYATSGTYTVRLTTTFNNGIIDTQRKTITINSCNNNNIFSLFSIQGGNAIEAGQSITFYDDSYTTNSQAINDWTWWWQLPRSAGLNNPSGPNTFYGSRRATISRTYNTPGEYKVRQLVWNCLGATATEQSYSEQNIVVLKPSSVCTNIINYQNLSASQKGEFWDTFGSNPDPDIAGVVRMENTQFTSYNSKWGVKKAVRFELKTGFRARASGSQYKFHIKQATCDEARTDF